MQVRLGERNWLSKMTTRMVRRWRRPSLDRVPDYLLQDAGLERIVGVIGRRPR
jgi:hypothetical protein